MAASGFQHLTLDERRFMFRMQEAWLGVTEMAARLGQHRSTTPASRAVARQTLS